MNTLISLTKRNTKIFLRDKATVFFSFLSTLILVLLYFLFIAKSYTSSMNNTELGDAVMTLTDKEKNAIVYLQMIAGVLILNSMSLATGAFTTIAKDFESSKIDSLLLTTIKPLTMLTSYFLTALVTSFSINACTWLLSFFIIGFATGLWLSFPAFVLVLLVLFVASLISCALMLLVTALIKSSTAIGVVNGISGTFFGFLCGIYMPYSNFGSGIKAVGSFLPFSHLAIWLKQVVLGDAFSQIGIDGELKNIFYDDFFSASSIGICGIDSPLWMMVLLSGIIGLICLFASLWVLKRRIKR